MEETPVPELSNQNERKNAEETPVAEFLEQNERKNGEETPVADLSNQNERKTAEETAVVVELSSSSDQNERKNAEEKPIAELSNQNERKNAVTFAVAGCAHGDMDKIYETIKFTEEQQGVKVDILLCCGDFQAVRNYSDLKCMAVPTRYQQLQTFYKYYSGECVAPYLTVFIGGNHEASNYLAELPYGGWVAPNIYYLGYAGVVKFRGLRIGGFSGIYRGREMNKGHYECPPYNENAKRTAYYVRNLEMFRLKQLKQPSGSSLDIVLSHDWPSRITDFGDSDWLFRVKPFFKDDAQSGKLGNRMAMGLLKDLKPKFWFSAHLHVKFPAIVPHEEGGETRFLALDKCLPSRGFLQVLEVEAPCEPGENDGLEYDEQWLAVLKSTDHLWNTTRFVRYMPGPGMGTDERFDFHPTEEEISEIQEIMGNNLKIPENFCQTAPPHDDTATGSKRAAKSQARQSLYYRNPQTTEFCKKLEILDLNAHLLSENPECEGFKEASVIPPEVCDPQTNPDEIDLDELGNHS